METNNYALERAVMRTERERTSKELQKHVPDIELIDPKRMAFCAIQTRIDLYKEHGHKQALVITLSECGISTTAYYEWYEKYYAFYKQCKKL